MGEERPLQATPYADVNTVLDLLLREGRAILGERLVGLYLYGSLSSGDFDPASSDIDFLVVTADELEAETLAALEAMHARIAASGLKWATKLEGSYIPQAALRRYDPANARHPSVGADWAFGVWQHGQEWVIQRYIVREMGVTVWGPPPRTLIDPVTADDLRKAVCASLHDFWAEQLAGPEWLRTRDYQAFAILTMCRALHTLDTGTLVSKPVAATWAMTRLGPPWAALIERALGWRADKRADDMGATLDFIRFTVAHCAPA